MLRLQRQLAATRGERMPGRMFAEQGKRKRKNKHFQQRTEKHMEAVSLAPALALAPALCFGSIALCCVPNPCFT
jgi:hypothetical protein